MSLKHLSLLLLSITLLIGYSHSHTHTKTQDPITVHVVPHTHDDGGWNWTFEEYYDGTDTSVSVHDILSNMLISLNNNPDRTFIYVEMAFFTKWYKQINQTQREQVKSLLKEGRFEFINGGYVMHDEAASYYQHYIDQTRLGLQFLKEEFNYRPEIAWFIDPFGHSASNAYVLAKMGFKKMAFVRIDYREKNIRRANKTLEFYWSPFHQIDSTTRIFTHITYEHYCLPDGIGDFIQDRDLNLPEGELINRADSIVKSLSTWNSGMRHKNVMLMYGCDFTFNKADNNYKNIEAAMKYINANRPEMKLIYSTPSNYFKSIFEQVEEWPVYNNQDFFPYADNEWSFWTGYLTSRPYLKGLVRETGNYLTTTSRFLIEYGLQSWQKRIIADGVDKLFSLREKHALCQHHDAVAGTAKEYVSEDYELMLNNSINDGRELIGDTLRQMQNDIRQAEIKVCISGPVSNVDCRNVTPTMSNGSEPDRRMISIVNPGLEGLYPVSLSFSKVDGVVVRESDGKVIVSDLWCIDMDGDFKDVHNCTLRFYYEFSKAKSVTTIALEFNGDNLNKIKPEKLEQNNGLVELISTGDMKLTFNPEDLSLTQTDLNKNNNNNNNNDYKYTIRHAYYNSYNGHNSKLRPNNSNSDGAYILSTVEEYPQELKVDYNKSYKFSGKLGSILLIRFETSYLVIYADTKPYFIDIESIFDPIKPTEKSNGKNLLLIIDSDIDNNVLLPDGNTQPEFWTDSNGMKLMRRFKDFRQGWKYTISDKVAGNFFPSNSMVSMRERIGYSYSENDYDDMNQDDRIITVFNDRPQSAGVMSKGQLMYLVHRWSENDDGRGVGQPIYEKSSADIYFRTRHAIKFGGSFTQSDMMNLFQNKPALVGLGSYNNFVEKDSLVDKMIDISASESLILNFQIKTDKTIFVQIYNMYDYYFEATPQGVYEESFRFNEVDGVRYNVVEYDFSSVEPLKVGRSNGFLKFMDYKDNTHTVKAQDFRLFLITLE